MFEEIKSNKKITVYLVSDFKKKNQPIEVVNDLGSKIKTNPMWC